MAEDANSPRHWTDYVDLALKGLIPITVLVVTVMIDSGLEDRREQQACLDSQMSLIQFVCGDKDSQCRPSVERAGHVPQVAELVKRRCKAGLPAELTEIAINATGGAGDADATAKLSVQSGQAQAKPELVAAAKAPDLAPAIAEPTSTGAGASTAATLAPRLYIQIKSEDQRPAAEQFRTAVGRGSLNGMSIVAPGVQLVPASGVKNPELRCVTKSDCALAPNLAAYLGVLLGTPPLRVRDLSARYEGKGGARPNHFEIWFGDGPIRLSPAAAAQSAIPPAPAPAAAR